MPAENADRTMAFSRKFGPKKPLEPARALLRLEELCARSEHCEGELREKLRKWLVSEEDADTILSSLRRRRYVDDERFARAYVRDKFRFDHWGRRKIELTLRRKRVDADVIADALEEIDADDYMAMLRKLLAYKARSLPDAGAYENRVKLMRFAIGRGFEPQLVVKALDSMK